MFNTNEQWEQIDLFDWFKDVIDTSIHDMIKNKLGFDQESQIVYGNISFFPIYGRCKKTGEKTLRVLKLKYDNIHFDYVGVTLDEIEKSGASWEEFIDFLILSDAKFVYYKDVL